MSDHGSIRHGSVEARLPPHNLDAEKSSLGAVLIKPSAFDELATMLVAEDFFLPAHREIFDAMLVIQKRRQPIDPIALGDELQVRGSLPRLEGGEAYIMALASGVPTAENVGHYVRLVKEKSTLRRLIGACAEIQSRAYGEFGDYEGFLDEAEATVFKVAQRNRQESYQRVGQLVTPTLAGIEARAKAGTEITGVATGFQQLDELTGGLQPENVIVVAARPGVGKTSWAVNVAMNAAIHNKIPVLIFSLEMSKSELMERILAGEARLDSNLLRRGIVSYPDYRDRLYPAGGRLSEAPLAIDDTAAPTILEIRAKARRFRADPDFFPPPSLGPDGSPVQQLGLIIVDYLQLARGPGGKREESREREIAEISRGLKALAKELKVPILVVSQLNRDLDKRAEKMPQLSDLRESGAIEQDADLILFISRPELWSPDEAVQGKAQLVLAKNRHGPTGLIPLTFIKEYTRFENLR